MSENIIIEEFLRVQLSAIFPPLKNVFKDQFNRFNKYPLVIFEKDLPISKHCYIQEIKGHQVMITIEGINSMDKSYDILYKIIPEDELQETMSRIEALKNPEYIQVVEQMKIIKK